MELAGESQAVGGVAGLKLGIQRMGRLEEGHTERATVALEPVPQGRKRAVLVHPLAQIAEDLIVGPDAVQPFQPGPLVRLGLADEGERLGRENRALPVEGFTGDRHIPVLEQMRFDDGLEGGFGRALHRRGLKSDDGRSRQLRFRQNPESERRGDVALPGISVANERLRDWGET